MSPPPSSCPDDNLLQAMMAGRVDAATRATLVVHLDGCAACRGLLAVLVAQTAAGRGARARVSDDAADRSVDASAAEAATIDASAPDAGAGLASTADGAAARADRGGRGAGGATLGAGARLDRYEIRERLGAGGMGVVFAAHDPQLGRDVAIKVLRRPGVGVDHSAVADRRQRLAREARAMAQVNHPNVVAVYDVGEVDGQVYLAMELVRGDTLRGWARAARRSPREVVEVFLAAGRGLAAAHAAGIVHRDFKPDNVLIGRDGRPRVTDFGLAGRGRAAVSAGAGASADGETGDDGAGPGPSDGLDGTGPALTQAGQVIGTPVYMAPEQFDAGNVDARSDQWAFCVALYEALFAVRPFTGKNWDELAARVRAGERTEPPTGHRVSPRLRRIVERGLAVRPGDRHPTMEALLAELGRDRGRRWRQAALVATLGAVIIGAGLVTSTAARRRAEHDANTAFTATGNQLERAVALRYDAFAALADAAYAMPVMNGVFGHKDQADFGFGDAAADRAALEAVHDSLQSADWLNWARRTARAVIAVGDYKGRLLYSSAGPDRWGHDLRGLPVVARAFAAAPGSVAEVVDHADPRLATAGLATTGADGAGVAVVLARAFAVGDVPAAVFIQAIDGGQLLADVTVGDDVLTALRTDAGAVIGTVPHEVATAAPLRAIRETRVGGVTYLTQARPLPNLDGSGSIATLVLARRIDPGVVGWFAGARLAWLGASVLLLLGGAAAAWRARALR